MALTRMNEQNKGQHSRLTELVEKKQEGIDVMSKINDKIEADRAELKQMEEEYQEKVKKVKSANKVTKLELKEAEKKQDLKYSKKSIDMINSISKASPAQNKGEVPTWTNTMDMYLKMVTLHDIDLKQTSLKWINATGSNTLSLSEDEMTVKKVENSDDQVLAYTEPFD